MAGSIGAFVELSRKTREALELPLDVPLRAFASVSHVLAPPGVNADKDDYILSPGPPDVPRVAIYRCAKLKNFTELTPPGGGKGPTIINDHDIAFAVMNDLKQVSNHIPNPENTKQLVTLDGIHSDEEIKKIVADSAPVFMFGRKTGFSKGKLIDISRATISLEVYPNYPFYFRGCLVVKSNDPKMQFSVRGDSGALVYSRQRKAVGFVIGANGCITYLYSAKSSLDYMGLNLL